MSCIVITGAGGLIGNALRTSLEADGVEVLATDLDSQTEEGRPLTRLDVLDRAAFCDLLRDRDVAALVHCGGASGPMVRPEDPTYVWNVNTIGTVNALEAVRLAGVPKLVYCSSTSAFGTTPAGLDLVPEDVPLHPSTVYAASKAAGEQIAEAYARQFDFSVTSLRFSWVFGPRRTTDCLIRTMITDAMAGRPTTLPYGMGFHRQYVYIDDVVQGLRAALRDTTIGHRVYTITGNSYITIEALADAVRDVYPEARITVGEGPDPQDEIQARFDLSRAETDLGYRPGVTLVEGIRAYGAWLAQ